MDLWYTHTLKSLDLYPSPLPLTLGLPALQVISAVGFSPVWVGELRYSRNLESMAELWIHMAIKYGWPRDGFAFDILKA